MKYAIHISLAAMFTLGLATGIYFVTQDRSMVPVAEAAEHQGEELLVSPTEARERDFYAPNSESLKPDEMRVIACGTGMPTTRAAQAAACFLVELGNGDKFLFDIGSGSAERISSLQIPYNFLDKVFVGHLHTDHFGALHDLFIGGALMGRNVPLRVWGPSGQVPELGTKYALEHMEKMLTWDLSGRVGMTDFRGYHMEVNEFDYKGVNEVIYDVNGVVIRSFPAIHSIDGSVSFTLEWNDLKFVFSSDTYPNHWFAEYAKDADLVIHECFIAVPDLVAKMGWTPEMALMVGTQIHTAPEAFGKVMSTVEPRMAVAYHFFKDFDTTAAVYERIRTRLAVVEHHTWGPPPARKSLPGNPEDKIAWAKDLGVDSLTYSDFIAGGAMDVEDVIRPIYKEASEVLDREFPYPADNDE